MTVKVTDAGDGSPLPCMGRSAVPALDEAQAEAGGGGLLLRSPRRRLTTGLPRCAIRATLRMATNQQEISAARNIVERLVKDLRDQRHGVDAGGVGPIDEGRVILKDLIALIEQAAAAIDALGHGYDPDGRSDDWVQVRGFGQEVTKATAKAPSPDVVAALSPAWTD